MRIQLADDVHYQENAQLSPDLLLAEGGVWGRDCGLVWRTSPPDEEGFGVTPIRDLFQLLSGRSDESVRPFDV